MVNIKFGASNSHKIKYIYITIMMRVSYNEEISNINVINCEISSLTGLI